MINREVNFRFECPFCPFYAEFSEQQLALHFADNHIRYAHNGFISDRERTQMLESCEAILNG